MKVYLDDLRHTPDGWERAYTAQEAIEFLKTGMVEEISLDHDLGDEEIVGNGYHVIAWLEEQVFCHGFKPPIIHIHTANNAAGYRMETVKKRIDNFVNADKGKAR